MPIVSDIYYFKLNDECAEWVSIGDMFILSDLQRQCIMPVPQEGWLNGAGAALDANMGDVVRRYSGVKLREMPWQAFLCSTLDLRLGSRTLSGDKLSEYLQQLRDIVDGYEEGPNEEIELKLRSMIALAYRREKRARIEDANRADGPLKKGKLLFK